MWPIPLIALLLALPGQDDAYQKAVDSVVKITAWDKNWDATSGTGVAIDDKHILTAYHVAAGRMCIFDLPKRDKDGAVIGDPAAYRRGGEFCIVVAVDAKRDLALLKIKDSTARPLPLAARSASPGAAVFTIGNGSTMFHYAGGAVRQVCGEQWTFPGGQRVEARTVEMTVPVNGGDSGGPIINASGEIVGINSGVQADKNQVNLGIDIAEVRAFLDEYRKEGK